MDSFEELFNKHRGRLYALAYGMLKNREDALDVCQEAFIRAHRAFVDFRKEAQVSTWLYRITVNLCIDHQRRESGRRRFSEREDEEGSGPLELAPAGEEWDPGVILERSEVRDKVVEALQKLTGEHRAVLILREFQGFSYREIAKVLQCSEGTVMSRLHYGRKRMRELLAPLISEG